jgi:hypothetical protein
MLLLGDIEGQITLILILPGVESLKNLTLCDKGLLSEN